MRRHIRNLSVPGDGDDRVVPAHSFKYAAAVQGALTGADADGGPVLLRVEISAGQGSGKPATKQIIERTDFLASLEQALGMG